jgi:anthranilate phosphoribosyltransferase
MDIRTAIAGLVARRDLTEAEMESVVNEIMDGRTTPAQMGAFLAALRMKGEHIDEVVGAARALRHYATAVTTSLSVVDTCGTGGDLQGTFNISTAAALIAAGADIPVAKHGNRAMSGTVGGADVLEALGVRLELTAEEAADCLAHAGMVFLFAPAFHPAMRHIAGPRREVGVRTIFNLLGPLANPAGARAQLLGVFGQEWVVPLAEALGRLGSKHALVVHGEDGLDEISLTGRTVVAELIDGKVRSYFLEPEELDLQRCSRDALRGGDVQVNAAIVRNVLAGTATEAQMAIALLNAAAVIYVADRAPTLAAAVTLAREAVRSGRAQHVLDKLVRVTNAARA